jgi:DNA-directed RNA polymerase specialized sigma24 family protein
VQLSASIKVIGALLTPDGGGERLVTVLRKLDSFHGDAELSTWLHRVTINAALAQRRKQARCRLVSPGSRRVPIWSQARRSVGASACNQAIS